MHMDSIDMRLTGYDRHDKLLYFEPLRGGTEEQCPRRFRAPWPRRFGNSEK
jgi:hypothetical protein